jgi:hypothetical protein
LHRVEHVFLRPIPKADHGCGGGALRFYGIQLIAFVATFGEVESVVESKLFFDESNDAYDWVAHFAMKNGMMIHVDLLSQSPKNQFKLLISGNGKEYIIDQDGPFDGETKIEDQDIRVKALSNLLNTFEKENNKYYENYSLINANWWAIEAKTQFINIANHKSKEN